MNIPKLQINSTKAQIGLNIQKPVQQIEQPSADLDLQQPKAVQTMKTTKPKLSIDTEQARADVDLKSVRKRMEDFAAEGHQAVSEGTVRRAQQGTELMRIENGGNPIASQAKQSGRQHYSSLGIKFIPSQGSVKVNFQPGSVDIQIEPQKVINNTSTNKPIHNYTPGKVKVEMLHHASLTIDWLV
ncbi:DUF6470 family protein [Psychrobacillus lasiicapitis]|uniref:YviE n=1 Tax=Psychrobacillus lasiicapitis TaxID=1636719 RepID=A0A544TE19_9BACI|nr:DUF6470 family protein [Psychrobacillus lasiicapitis]TQR15717.1 hypothetical protein FG382_03140 [Psychrobacillus lasiicapitis]GGA18580.1 hypothetical protein GCM10011384_04670 [Psychrobacillus lasiicapitis]